MAGIVDQLTNDISVKIARGELVPGQQLHEHAFCSEFGVSRNTLREAFRIVCAQGLAVHYPRRGVFIREIHEEDLADIYAYRRFVELGALRTLPPHETCRIMLEACDEAEAARTEGDWQAVGTANSKFHLALVDGVGCERLSQDMRLIMAQARLAFMTPTDWSISHSPFVDANRAIANALSRGELDKAYILLEDYFHQAEAVIRDEVVNRGEYSSY
ncbi:MAG: GntR family transcriptional regulator [Corynebacterium sp.]|nr:GntR family transcriptional regulator [Corynebacterium sp.]